MPLIAKDNTENFDFELAPEGNHIAVCYLVCDLGVHESAFQGKITAKRKVRISFEIPGETMEDGRPFSVSKNYTLSLNEKANLRKDLQSWRGRAFTEQELDGFDIFNVLGHACMVNVIHTTSDNNGNTYANIASIAALPKGIPAPKAKNELIAFSLDDYSDKIFNKLPEWLQKKINMGPAKSKVKEIVHEPANNDFDDDIPF